MDAAFAAPNWSTTPPTDPSTIAVAPAAIFVIFIVLPRQRGDTMNGYERREFDETRNRYASRVVK